MTIFHSINASGIWEQHITADGKVNYLMFHMKHWTTTSKGKGDVTNAFETKVLTNNFMLWFVTNFFVTAKCPYLWQNIKHDRKSKLKITILLRYWSKFTGQLNLWITAFISTAAITLLNTYTNQTYSMFGSLSLCSRWFSNFLLIHEITRPNKSDS